MNIVRRAVGGRTSASNRRSTVAPLVKSRVAYNRYYTKIRDTESEAKLDSANLSFLVDSESSSTSESSESSESSEYSSYDVEPTTKTTPAAVTPTVPQRVSVAEMSEALQKTMAMNMERIKKQAAQRQKVEDERRRSNAVAEEQIVKYVHNILMSYMAKGNMLNDAGVKTCFRIVFDLDETAVIRADRDWPWYPSMVNKLAPMKVDHYIDSYVSWSTDVCQWINDYLERSNIDIHAVISGTLLIIGHYPRDKKYKF